jgi:hypothetical protein
VSGITIAVAVSAYSFAIADQIQFAGELHTQLHLKAAAALNRSRKHNAEVGQVKVVCMAYGKAALVALAGQIQQKVKHGVWNGAGKDFVHIHTVVYTVMVDAHSNVVQLHRQENVGMIFMT